ncbi:SDR family oxidoreductase [Amycolatopsis sp. NPDC059657]|uniref:SDR family oxidoreductase n=1 Tax=Amycolatopsis sp. NPDC059657 TaxID=3346899 RepID=UPI00366E5FEE
MTATRILCTGLGGVVGTELSTRLAGFAGAAEVVGVFSSPESRLRFLDGADPVLRGFLRAEVCDLTDPAQTAALAAVLGTAERTVVVHAAANTAWTLPLAVAMTANVEATRNVADLARASSGSARMIYVSSAFTSPENWLYRNTYEESKARAERMLRAEYPDLDVSVFSCSLVVGHSETGAVARFHGLYPLLKFIEGYEVPVVPGDRGRRLDIVPVDWVADELCHLLAEAVAGESPRDVVASAGAGAPKLPELIAGVAETVNRRRDAEGRPRLPEIAVFSMRQWDFLRRSLVVWQAGTASLPPARILDLLMDTYRPYLEDDRVLPPSGVSAPAPAFTGYLPAVVDYWLDRTSRAGRLVTA